MNYFGTAAKSWARLWRAPVSYLLAPKCAYFAYKAIVACSYRMSDAMPRCALVAKRCALPAHYAAAYPCSFFQQYGPHTSTLQPVQHMMAAFWQRLPTVPLSLACWHRPLLQI